MEECLRDHDLQLATLKTKIVVFTRQRTCKKFLQVGIDGTYCTLHYAKHLEVTGYERYEIRTHSEASCISVPACQIVDGSRACTRMVLINIFHSVIKYSAGIWVDALNVE